MHIFADKDILGVRDPGQSPSTGSGNLGTAVVPKCGWELMEAFIKHLGLQCWGKAAVAEARLHRELLVGTGVDSEVVCRGGRHGQAWSWCRSPDCWAAFHSPAST